MAFNFTIHTWAPGSIVELCRVDWSSDYKDVVLFKDEESRAAYFSGLASSSVTLQKMSFCKYGQPIKINIPFEDAYTYNYCVVSNPNSKDKYYYFINSVDFSAPETSILNVQLDAFQTYLFKFKINQAFVERSHVNIMKAQHNAEFTKNAQRYLTVPEGLNTGTDYRVCGHDVINLSLQNWKVIICSTTDLAADWGNLQSPNLKTADGQQTDRILSGCNVYQLDIEDFEKFMDKISNAPWVASGIISLTVFPKSILTDGPEVKIGGINAQFLGETPDEGDYYARFSGATYRPADAIPGKYRCLTKFLTYPYSVIEVNNFSGSSLMLKPEMLNSNSLELKNISCATPGHQRIGFYVSSYGVSDNDIGSEAENIQYIYIDGTGESREGVLEPGYNHDLTLWFDSLPQLSLVKDNYIQWIASTQNSRQYSYDSAGWGRDKANTNAQMNYNQNQAALDVAKQNQLLGLATSGLNLATTTGAGFAAGGPVGATIGAGVGLAGIGANYLSFQNSQALQNQVIEQNYQLAQYATQGDYQNAIKGINATVQDMALTQPSQVAQAGGNGFNLSNGLFLIEVRFKTLSQNNIAIIGDFWTRFGYAVNEYMTIENLQPMKKFCYWKCQEIYLTCTEATENVKDTLRGIFTRGTTVWSNPREIGTTDIYDNYN